MKIKFSFIIPVYNGEAFIENCVRSCLEVSGEKNEIIIVNDGSTDGTADIIEKLCEENKIIKSVHIKNSGLSVARNTGVQNSNGDYIIFVDADDWLTLDMKKAMSLMTDDLDVCFYNANDVRVEENFTVYPQRRYPFDEDKIYTGDEVLSIYTDMFIPNEVWHGIYNREFLNKYNVEFIPGLLYEDNAFWFNVMKYAKKIKYTNLYCYNYLIHPDSITTSNATHRNIISVFELIEEILSGDNLTENYLGTAALKLPKLMYACEKRIETAKINEFLKECGNLLNRKKKLVERIEIIYKENTKIEIINKYLLLSEYVFFLGIYDESLKQRVFFLREKVVDVFSDFMKTWPLDRQDKTVGIYGSGRNSDLILEIYNKVIGKVKAEIFYIDSYKKSGEYLHLNHKIINVSELDDYGIEDVIVCSIKYEKELSDKIDEMWPDKKKYLVYDGNEFMTENILCDNFAEIILEYEKYKDDKKIILFETPEYPNVGDHLITHAEKLFLNDYCPSRKIIEVNNDENHFYKARLKSMIQEDDIIIINGGGYFGTLWKEAHYNEALDVIEAYTDNFIVVMPQSVHFSDDAIGESYKNITKRLFNRKKLKVCLREKYSYQYLIELGVNEDNLFLLPDIAFYIGQDDRQYNKKKNKIGLFIRHDKESILSSNILEIIKSHLDEKGYEYSYSSMQYPTSVFKEMREWMINEKMTEISESYDLVFTDQLHCMILCALLRKPCIAFGSISRKTEGVYQWIKKLNYIEMVSDEKQAIEAFERLIVLNESEYGSIDFKEKWNELASIMGFNQV